MTRSTVQFVLAITMLATAQAQNLCKPGERVVESCVGAHKIASVCASRDLTATTGYLQYRFGTKKNIELEFPDSSRPAASYVHSDRFSGSGGGSSYFGLQNGDFSYVFYSFWRKPDWQENPDNPSCHGPCDGYGMVVLHKGSQISRLSCAHGIEGTLFTPEEISALGITPSDDMAVDEE